MTYGITDVYKCREARYWLCKNYRHGKKWKYYGLGIFRFRDEKVAAMFALTWM